MKTFVLHAVVPLLVAGMLSGCFVRPNAKKDEPGKKGDEVGVPVEVVALGRGPIESTLKLSKWLEAEEQVKVLSRSANRVTELLVEEGDAVERGQLLLRLENEIQKVALGKAEVDYERASREFLRQQSLFKQELISEQEFTEARLAKEQAELSRKDAQRELDYTEVKAPIEGTISLRLVKLGDYVTVNQELFNIVDFNSMVAVVYHPEKYLQQLSIGQPARVYASALGAQEYQAFVKRISPVIESKTGTIKVTLGFKEIGLLRPGMHVDTEIVLATHDHALLVPKRALVYDGDQTFIYRLKDKAGRRVERIEVIPRLADPLHVVPDSGLEEGDEIVVAGQTGLKDGALVRLPGDPDPEDETDAGKDARDASREAAQPAGEAAGNNDESSGSP